MAFIGPFALPLLWRNPRFKTSTKIAGSVIILIVTLVCVWIVKRSAEYVTGVSGIPTEY